MIRDINIQTNKENSNESRVKKLLITGGSGFLGKNITPLLSELYLLSSLGLSRSDKYRYDLASDIPKLSNNYEIIIHAAGKAHFIPNTKNEVDQFFRVNLEGTKNLCKALESKVLPKAFIFVSSSAVYGVESGINITEMFPLNGSSPYALSKIHAEEYLTSWCKDTGVILGILRPPLIAGKNPPGNLGAMIQGIKHGRYFRIGNGTARKSILMAADIARVIPKLSEEGGVYNICDNYHPSIAEIETLISNQLGVKTPRSIPLSVAKVVGKIGDILGQHAPFNTSKYIKLTESLTFSNLKAKKYLKWEPYDVLRHFVI